MRRAALALAALTCAAAGARAEQIGEVSTAFKLIGPNHKVVVEAFDDPKVQGVSCFVSRARKGGLSGALGVAEDTSDASIACRQTGPIRYLAPLEAGEQVFRKRTSLVFKTLQVVRFYDPARNTLVYLTYSDRLIDGSPKNAISAVVAAPWGAEPAPPPPEYRE
ncbi:CreA family protein [Oceanicella actignis]|uniref:CreA protein n=1 Tax=Oceanicella actignis TaxID=1189325 RepID=A0A1M7TP13_9RHOB|nr:CreA family protein [Oceanicella actignis]SET73335.1 CreA protein [Oceanicella actignis]SHN72494.1 CreA protein [Oceanicella actignis]